MRILRVLEALLSSAAILDSHFGFINPSHTTTYIVQPTCMAWESDTNTRGTSDIITACLSTLIFCVWSAVHLNIPPPSESWYSSLRRKFIWLFIGLLAPEVLLWTAFKDLLAARAIVQEAEGKLLFPPPGLPWYKQAVRTGLWRAGFYDDAWPDTVLQSQQSLSNAAKRPPQTIELGIPHRQRRRKYRWTLTHGFYVIMGGFAHDPDWDSTRQYRVYADERKVLLPEGISWCLVHNPDFIPDISEQTIHDRSKADGIAKTLLLMQAVWFCATCVSRLAQNLPLSLLEVSTLAHAFCTLITYLLWWKKPYNVAEPTILAASDNPYGMGMKPGTHYWPSHLELVPAARAAQGATLLPKLFTIFVCAIYGTPHAVAWNSAFPTDVERSLWRAAALIVCLWGVGIMADFYAAVALDEVFDKPCGIGGSDLVTLGQPVFVGVYICASLFLVVESFRQLLFLPPEAYDVPSWTSYFPHIS